VQAAREAARRSQCVNNLKQLALGFVNYESTNGCFAAGAVGPNNGSGTAPSIPSPFNDASTCGGGCPLGFFSWAAAILPYMEQPQVFNSINFSFPAYTTTFFQQSSATATGSERGPLGGLQNSTAALAQPMTFVCPSSAPRNNPGQAINQQKDYSVNSGYVYPGMTQCVCSDRFSTQVMNGFSAMNSWTKIADITDGTSNTVMLYEEAQWTDHSWIPLNKGSNPFMFVGHPSQGMTDSLFPPNSTAFNNRAPMSNHPGGVNAAMSDGSVRFIKSTINTSRTDANGNSVIGTPGVFQAISTRNMGEVIDASSF